MSILTHRIMFQLSVKFLAFVRITTLYDFNTSLITKRNIEINYIYSDIDQFSENPEH